MKLAVSNIAWDDKDNESVYKLMKNYGFRGLEVAPGKICSDVADYQDYELDIFRKKIEEYDIEPVSMQALLYGRDDLKIFDNIDSRKKTLEYLKNIIILAKKIGIKTLVFGSPKNRSFSSDLDKNKVIDISFDFFNDLGKFAFENGVNFCLEPNPISYGTNFLNNIQETVDFIKYVDNDGLKLIVDTSEIIMNEEVYDDILIESAPYIGHFHISEPDLQPLSVAYKDIHLSIAKILKSINYEGWSSVEMKPVKENNLDNISNALNFISNIYKNI